MDSFKHRREKRHHSKKEKKLIKLIRPSSESEDEGSEHELSYYLNDRVKMMKEVLKIIKSKKIKSMAPDCMKNLDSEEINSMLLEELLGISNKRLKYIFNGQNLNEESSSTDPEDQEAVDVISLDDISDDDLVIDLDSDHEITKKKRKKHKPKIKEEPRKRKVKKEKHHKEFDQDKKDIDNPISEKNLMSVLELLELQARARAIKSQLALENKKTEVVKENTPVEESDNDDSVIVESPKNIAIVITSSESEDDNRENSFRKNSEEENVNSNELSNSVESNSINNIKILDQTTIRQAQNNNKKTDKTNNESTADELKEKSPESDIPLPEQNKSLEIELVSDTSVNQEDDKSKEIKNSENRITESSDSKTANEGQENVTTDCSHSKDKEKTLHAGNNETSEANNENISNITSGKRDRKNQNDIDGTKHLEKKEAASTRLNDKNKRKIINKLKSIKCEKEFLGTLTKNKKDLKERKRSSDDSEEIVLDLEQSEIDCINLD